jgi:dihydroxy-acid dehydratase
MKSDLVKKGVDRSMHRALFHSMGLSRKDLDKPFIGIVNSYSTVVPGHIHLQQISQAVREGIRSAGGVPFEGNTIAVCDGIAVKHIGLAYSLPSREHIADSVEIYAESHAFDALVFITNCDKIVPGMLMGAARLNLPCIFVSGGPMLPGKFYLKDQEIILDEVTVFEAVGKTVTGELSEAEVAEMEKMACPGCGSCAGMFTANTMNCLTEVLGIALPGNGTIPAVHGRRIGLAYESGQQVMQVLDKNILARDVITKDAIYNAFAVTMATGGSTNAALHLPAIAHEAGIDFPLSLLNEISDRVPITCKLRPSGAYYIEDLDLAGGIPAVMKEIADRLRLDTQTVLGKKLGETIQGAVVRNSKVIGSISNPLHPTGGLNALFGNLAPDGSVIKTAAVPPEMVVHRGPARVFDCEVDAIPAIMEGKIKPGDVIVIRYEGPKGGPGMGELLPATSLLCGMGMDKDVAIVTDGRFSGGTRGIAVGHVSPEAAARGPIAIVQNGDMIEINIPEHRLNVDLDEKEIKRRLASLPPFKSETKSPYLKRYVEKVTSASTGAVLMD